MPVFESWLQAVTENVQFCYEKSEVQSLRMKSVQLCVIEEVTYNNSALLSDFFHYSHHRYLLILMILHVRCKVGA